MGLVKVLNSLMDIIPEVKVYVRMAFSAMGAGIAKRKGQKKPNRGNEWRLWALAHALDCEGSGTIDRADLARTIEALGVPGSTFRRWISSALKLGLFWQDGDQLRILGHPGAVRLFGCGRLRRPVKIQADLLFGDNWPAWIWAGFIATVSGPMSRSLMRQLTGVPERSQRAYEKQTGVKARAVYAKYRITPSKLTGFQEFTCGHGFVFKDLKDGNRKKLARRLPDIREAPKGVSGCGKGRTGKINKLAEAIDLYSEGGLVVPVCRLFHETQNQVNRTLKELTRKAGDLPDHIFKLTQHGVNVAMFQGIPVPVRVD